MKSKDIIKRIKDMANVTSYSTDQILRLAEAAVMIQQAKQVDLLSLIPAKYPYQSVGFSVGANYEKDIPKDTVGSTSTVSMTHVGQC